jgi:HK97 family phage prohead protease
MTRLPYMPLEEWRKEPRTDVMLRQGFTSEIKILEDTERTARFTISTDSEDRDKDTISITGWKLENYRKNPVVLWAHMYWQPPVGKAIELTISEHKLISTAKFTSQEEYEFGAMVYRLIKGGYLNATSVGFQPLKWSYSEERRGRYGPAVDFLEQELLEYSVVPVPANPEALIEARSLGIDIAPLKGWAMQVLEETEGKGLWLPEDVLRRAMDIAGNEKRSFVMRTTNNTNDTPTEAPAEKTADLASEAASPDARELAGSDPTNTELRSVDEQLATVLRQFAGEVAEIKAGRVLSAANESRIQQIADLAKEVLETVKRDAEEAEDDETDANDSQEEKSINGGGDEFLLELADDDTETFTIDESELKNVLADAFRSLKTAVTGRLD